MGSCPGLGLDRSRAFGDCENFQVPTPAGDIHRPLGAGVPADVSDSENAIAAASSIASSRRWGDNGDTLIFLGAKALPSCRLQPLGGWRQFADNRVNFCRQCQHHRQVGATCLAIALGDAVTV